MIGKSTFDITLRNVKLTFKLLLMTAILLTVLIVVIISIFSPLWVKLSAYFAEVGAVAGSENFIASLIDKAGETINQFWQEETTSLIATVGYTVLAIFISKFVLSLTMVPTGAVIATQMTTDFTEKYVTTTIQNIRKSFVYSLIGSVVSILLDIPFSALIIYISVCLAPSFGVFAYPTGLILFVLYFAVRTSLTSLWIPNVVLGEKAPLSAFLTTIKDTPKTFSRLFVGNLCIISVMILIAFATMVVTMFASLTIIIPAYMVTFLVYSLVSYCHIHNQNYFVAKDTVVTVKEKD